MALQWTKSEDGYTETKDGRFRIEPQFNHGTKPWSYRLYDRGLVVNRSLFTQAAGKALAARLVDEQSLAARLVRISEG
jgi:hypothetical protein